MSENTSKFKKLKQIGWMSFYLLTALQTWVMLKACASGKSFETYKILFGMNLTYLVAALIGIVVLLFVPVHKFNKYYRIEREFRLRNEIRADLEKKRKLKKQLKKQRETELRNL